MASNIGSAALPSGQPSQPPDPVELTRVIALDGPAGTGKSSVARLTARALGWRFVDTGATYRAATLRVLRAGVDPTDAAAVARAVATADIQLAVDPTAPGVRLDGADVSREIRGPEVTAAVSAVSSVPAVRQQLIQLQRAAMGTEGAVVEGRDIATVVAPRATVKVFLDARPEVRARRRAGDVAAVAGSASHDDAPDSDSGDLLAQVQEALAHRDAADSQTNLLEVSDGAVHIDTSDLSLAEVVAEILALAEHAGLRVASQGEVQR